MRRTTHNSDRRAFRFSRAAAHEFVAQTSNRRTSSRYIRRLELLAQRCPAVVNILRPLVPHVDVVRPEVGLLIPTRIDAPTYRMARHPRVVVSFTYEFHARRVAVGLSPRTSVGCACAQRPAECCAAGTSTSRPYILGGSSAAEDMLVSLPSDPSVAAGRKLHARASPLFIQALRNRKKSSRIIGLHDT